MDGKDPAPQSSTGPRSCGTAGRWQPHAPLEIGRVAVSHPKQARLDVHQKPDGRRGGSVLSYDNGGRYRATAAVASRFEPGSHEGWAFLNREYGVAFAFLPQGNETPTPQVSIEALGEYVLVKRHVATVLAASPGTWVAFRAGVVGDGAQGRPKRKATDVLRLDREHPLRIAQLITAGRTVMPRHHEVVDLFLDSLPGWTTTAAAGDRELVEAALERLGADPAVPASVQMLARAERSRLMNGAGVAPASPPASPAIAPKHDGQQIPAGGTGTKAAQTSVSRDIERVNLQFD
jgi:hypothetical protein